MDDDKKLKIVFYAILIISVAVIIGVWESLVKPIIGFIGHNFNIMLG
ncbi:MAG: hypothetical protein WC518_00020 [Patescibacteria group bacterium]